MKASKLLPKKKLLEVLERAQKLDRRYANLPLETILYLCEPGFTRAQLDMITDHLDSITDERHSLAIDDLFGGTYLRVSLFFDLVCVSLERFVDADIEKQIKAATNHRRIARQLNSWIREVKTG